jgi:septum formation protein
MLTALSGRTHEVFTGVCVLYEKDGERVKIVDAARTEVEFNELSDDFIRAYIEGGSPMDKAGAYGIQDGGLVKSIRGSYSNVVGLPVELLERILKEIEVE